jgi:hypothetical protein
MTSYNIIFPSPYTSNTGLNHKIRRGWQVEQHTVPCLMSSCCTNRHIALHTWKSTPMYFLPVNNRTLRNKHVMHNAEILPPSSSSCMSRDPAGTFCPSVITASSSRKTEVSL